jgi:hypothetical protein
MTQPVPGYAHDLDPQQVIEQPDYVAPDDDPTDDEVVDPADPSFVEPAELPDLTNGRPHQFRVGDHRRHVHLDADSGSADR